MNSYVRWFLKIFSKAIIDNLINYPLKRSEIRVKIPKLYSLVVRPDFKHPLQASGYIEAIIVCDSVYNRLDMNGLKVNEDVSKDDHFMQGPWLQAIVYLHGEGLSVSGCLGDMKKIASKVAKVMVEEGMEVEKGQPMFVLNLQVPLGSIMSQHVYLDDPQYNPMEGLGTEDNFLKSFQMIWLSRYLKSGVLLLNTYLDKVKDTGNNLAEHLQTSTKVGSSSPS
ncbi:hypothetical protein Tco_1175555 [Tanacetum coccineum]